MHHRHNRAAHLRNPGPPYRTAGNAHSHTRPHSLSKGVRGGKGDRPAGGALVLVRHENAGAGRKIAGIDGKTVFLLSVKVPEPRPRSWSPEREDSMKINRAGAIAAVAAALLCICAPAFAASQ